MIKSKTQDLAYFVTLAENGSFTETANLLDTQVAKVSRSISRLEQEHKITLFNRSTRSVELTEEGSVFLNYVRQALQLLNRGEEALNNLKGVAKGKLRVDAASPFIFHQIIPHIEAFRLAYPEIELDLVSNENIIDLIEKKTDIAIRIGQLTDSNLHAKHLGRSQLHLVASPRYLAKAGTPSNLTELLQHQHIGFADAPKLNNWFLPQAKRVRPSLNASSGETIRQLAINGNGIALLSGFMVNKDIKDGLLQPLLPDLVMSPNPREEVNAVYYKHSAVSVRIRAFLDFFAPRFVL